jgi:hypothetical protein
MSAVVNVTEPAVPHFRKAGHVSVVIDADS